MRPIVPHDTTQYSILSLVPSGWSASSGSKEKSVFKKNLGFWVHHFESTGSDGSAGEQRKVTGVHDEARVQVQVILIKVVEFLGVGSFTESLHVHKIAVDI